MSEPTESTEPSGIDAAPAVTTDIDEALAKGVLESLVFVADQPVTAQKLARCARVKLAVARQLLSELVEEYSGRGVELVQVGSGYQFRSAVTNANFVRAFIAQRPVRLSRAQLEVLSIIGYRQPVTRPEMEDIRGVDSGSALKVLLERGLLKILGRKEEPGRPLIYGTSPFFLEFFGLRSLKDLPTLREFSELSDESRALFERRIGEPFEAEALTADARDESDQDTDGLAANSDDDDEDEDEDDDEDEDEDDDEDEDEDEDE